MSSMHPPRRQTAIRQSLWCVLVGAVGGLVGLAVISILNRVAFGRGLSPNITPGAEGITQAIILSLVIAAAMSALVAAAAGPKILMERADVDVLGRQRAVFLAFLGANMVMVVLAVIGMKMGGMIAPVLLVLGLVAYGPVALRLLGIPLGGSPVSTPGAGGGSTATTPAYEPTPLAAVAPAAAPLPPPRAPRPPASVTPLADPAAPYGDPFASTPAPAGNPQAAAHWLIDFALWADTLPALLERARTAGQWGELASERQRAHDFADNLPDAGQAEMNNAMAHLRAALAAMSAAADPEALAAATLQVDALRTRVIEDARVRAFVTAHR